MPRADLSKDQELVLPLPLPAGEGVLGSAFSAIQGGDGKKVGPLALALAGQPWPAHQPPVQGHPSSSLRSVSGILQGIPGATHPQTLVYFEEEKKTQQYDGKFFFYVGSRTAECKFMFFLDGNLTVDIPKALKSCISLT